MYHEMHKIIVKREIYPILACNMKSYLIERKDCKYQLKSKLCFELINKIE